MMQESIGIRAENLLGQLERHYADYIEKCEKLDKSMKTTSVLFGRLFSGSDPASLSPIHDDFMAGTEKILSELAMTLNKLENEDQQLCNTIARKAVDRMMLPKKYREWEKTTAEWFMTAAENMCIQLLPYLSKEDLKYYHDFMLLRSPRRLMLPKQKELFDQIKKLLK